MTDSLTQAVADRIAIFCGQTLGGAQPSDLQGISDFCSDAISSLVDELLPGAPSGQVLAALLGLTGASDGATAVASLDAAMQRAFATVGPVIASAGIVPPRQQSGGPGPPASSTPAAAPPGGSASDDDAVEQALATLDPLATPDEAAVAPKLRKGDIAKYYFELWGENELWGTSTPTWLDIRFQFGSASVIKAMVPLFARALTSLGFHEIAPTAEVGVRVHQLLQTSYRMRHPDNVVILDAQVFKGGTQLGDLRQPQPPVLTGDPRIDTELVLAQFAYGFAKPLFDVSAAGANTYESKMFRPDILDLESGMIFEIKPVRGGKAAVAQLWAYQAFINAALVSDPDTFRSTISPGWWKLPTAVFPIDDSLRYWAFAFMFPGVGQWVPIPGVIFYIAFSAEESMDDEEALSAILTALLIKTLSSMSKIPTSEIPTSENEPEPPFEDPGPESWQPNAHDPFEDDPVPDDQDSEEIPWGDSPEQPGTQAGVGPAKSSSPSYVETVWIVILILLALVIIAWLIILAGRAIAAAILATLAALGVEGLTIVAAAALLIIIVRAMLKRSDKLATTTLQVFGNSPEQTWADVAAALSGLGGLSADDVANLHIG